MTRRASSGRSGLEPPRLAVALLCRRLPADQRDMVVGDLTELYADRVESGRALCGAWFWMQSLAFVLGFASSASAVQLVAERPRRLIMGRLSTSVRQSIRRLTFEWRYAAGVVLILAVGIGPAAAMLSVVQTVLLRPLDYADSDRLAIARLHLGQIQNHPGLSQAEITDLRGTTGLFSGVEAASRRAEVSLGPDEALVPLSSISITPGLLPMLGVSPVRGRQFSLEEVDAQASVAMLDHDAWLTHFGGDPGIVGRTIQLNGAATEVVAVLPRGFRLTIGRGVPEPIDVYMTLRMRDNRSFWAFPTIVRLADGVSLEQANAGVMALTASLTTAYPETYEGSNLRFALHPLLDDMVNETRPAMRAAMAGVLLLLLIAMANATALVVARLKTREHDLAIRSAIGAGRRTLVAEVFVESLVLSGAGAVAGTLVAVGAMALARNLMPHSVPRWDSLSIGWELVAYSAAFSLAGLLAAGLVPVWNVSRSAPWMILRGASGRGSRAESATTRLVLVGAQIALTVVLAFGAIQLIRSAARLDAVDLGYDANVLAFRVPVDGSRFETPAESGALYLRMRDRLAQMPGIEAVGATSHLPLSGAVLLDAFSADLTQPVQSEDPVANYHSVLPGYLASMRMTLVAGRDITDAEFAAEEPVVVIDETLARAAFGDADPINRTLRLGWGIEDSRVVGVVSHARSIAVNREVRPQVYAPFSTFRWTPLHFTVRAAGDPLLMRQAVTEAVNEVGPGRAASNFQVLTDNVAAATSTQRSVTWLVMALAASAGLLSAIGLYTVIAYLVHQRRRATAIRAALGASRARLIWHHLRQSGVVMLAAIPCGVLLALALAPQFDSLVFGVSARDLTSLSAAATLAVVAGLLGAYLPVRRAAGINPVTVLKGD